MNKLKSLKKDISYEKVTGSHKQIIYLYDLLKARKHNISHRIIPSIKQHADFVKNHPYRVWYLLNDGDNYVGTVYLLKNNSIGFSCLENKYWALELTLQFIQNRYKPLKEIKSIRPSYFHINIPITNKKLIKYFEVSNAKRIQITYALAHPTKLNVERKN
jgi:hypothetical protein